MASIFKRSVCLYNHLREGFPFLAWLLEVSFCGFAAHSGHFDIPLVSFFFLVFLLLQEKKGWKVWYFPLVILKFPISLTCPMFGQKWLNPHRVIK